MGRLRLLAAAATLLAAGPAFAGTLTISTAASTVTPIGGNYNCGGAADCSLNVTELVTALAAADVTVAAGGVDADIIVANDITWASGSRLTLSAAQDIVLNASLAATNGGALTLRADAACLSVGGILPGSATIQANTLAYSHDDVNLTTTVVSGSLSAFKLIDTTGELSALPATGSFALCRDMVDPGGYTPIPTFGGVLDGLGHAVVNLLVPSGNGLFTALTSGATVSNIVLVRPGVSSMGDNVGALAGSATNAAIANIAVLDATIVGANSVGGVVGTVVASDLTRLY
ncbi:MAG TPA: hypothetical protein VLC93_18690, partial [Myxococcota bacterium]|nr:hypothetical protein [Myxococcota bacterium]